jgi:D-glycero-alpha-D-manno-heptose 1-phosphate guanylyltransferase
MDVIILAGGLGTRLRSVVSEVPKCMASVCGKPFLHYLFLYLSRFTAVKKIVLSLGYKSDMIIDWAKSQKNFGFEYSYSVETEPLGTGGAIKKALNYINGENILIMNGDTFFDIDLNMFLYQHISHNALLSVALKPMSNFERYGNVEINNEHVITSFKEKTCCKEVQINGGIYLLRNSQNILNDCPDKFSYETEFLQPQVQTGRVYGFIYTGYFIDIGIPEDYAKANTELDRYCNQN